MYVIEALKLPIRLSFIHRTPSHTEVKSIPQTSNEANETTTSPENDSQDTGIKTIDQLVRASIIDTKGDSEQTVRHNIFMARQWYTTFYRYPQDRAIRAWIIADHLKDEHGYAVAEQDTYRTN